MGYFTQEDLLQLEAISIGLPELKVVVAKGGQRTINFSIDKKAALNVLFMGVKTKCDELEKGN